MDPTPTHQHSGTMDAPTSRADWVVGAGATGVDRGQTPYVSNRSVLHMDPAQVERKRAMDRANQRLCRAKAKGRIQELEAENQQLKEKLSQAEHIVVEARQSEAKLKTILSNIRGALQPLNGQLLDAFDLPSDHAQQANIQSQPQPQPQSLATPPADSSSDALPLAVIDSGTGIGLGLGDDMASSEWIYLLGSEEQSANGNLVSLGWDEFRCPPPVVAENQRRLDLQIMHQSHPMAMPSSPASNSLSPMATSNTMTAEDESTWTTTLNHLPPTCQLDKVVLDVIHACTSSSPSSPSPAPPPCPSTNRHLSELRSPHFPSIPSLLNPRKHRDRYPVSSAFGDHALWMTIPGLPEKLACLYMCSTVTRWLASPSRETWLAMPSHMRPHPAQRLRPHPVWIDMVHWPAMRERAMVAMDWKDFHKFRAKTSAGLSVNWLGGADETFSAAGSPDSELDKASSSSSSVGGVDAGGSGQQQQQQQQQKQFRLSDEFVKHIRDIENWTLDVDFSVDFPFFEGLAPRRLGLQRWSDLASERTRMHF